MKFGLLTRTLKGKKGTLQGSLRKDDTSTDIENLRLGSDPEENLRLGSDPEENTRLGSDPEESTRLGSDTEENLWLGSDPEEKLENEKILENQPFSEQLSIQPFQESILETSEMEKSSKSGKQFPRFEGLEGSGTVQRIDSQIQVKFFYF